MANAKARFTVKRVYQVIDATTGEAVDEYGSLAAAKEYAAHQNELVEPLAEADIEDLLVALAQPSPNEAAEQNQLAAAPPRCLDAAFHGAACATYYAGRTIQFWCSHCQEKEKQAAIAKFPAEFGLRAFPGERFKISPQASYFSDYPAPNTLYLYTYIQKSDGGWSSFSKGTANELRGQIVNLKPALLSVEEAAEIRRKAGAR